MITTTSLQSSTPKDLRVYTVKDLGQLAKKLGVPGWHGMKKDELTRAIVRKAKAVAREKAKSAKSKSRSANGKSVKASSKPAGVARTDKSKLKSQSKSPAATKTNGVKDKPLPKSKQRERKSNPAVAARLAREAKKRQSARDLSTERKGQSVSNDRVALLVRDSYWLHAVWEVSRQSVQRAQAAMAEHWHTARPVLRLYQVEAGSTTSAAECALRDIPIHGGVTNWYIDVEDPPGGYRVDLGYLADNGRFFSLARSNSVTTPKPGSSDEIDENWTAVAEDYEKIFAMSGGNSEKGAGELQELFEERLRRPMGSPVVTQFGCGAERALNRERDFRFEVEAEMIVFGSSKPNAHVSIAGEPVKLRPDGTFTLRVAMPDRRQVLPIVASSPDGVEQRTIVLAVERNTKIMEPYVNDNSD